MQLKFSVWFCLFLLVCLGSACYMAYVDYPVMTGYPTSSKFQRSTTLNSGGTLSLRTFDGDIEIFGWEYEQVELEADRIPSLPEKSGGRVSSWDRDKYAPKIEFEKKNGHVNINTRSYNEEGKNTVVNYYISVPNAVNLQDIIARDGDIVIGDLYGDVYVELRNGNLNVDNFSGALSGTVEQGSIQSTLFDLRQEDEVKLRCKKGDITVYLEADVNAKIDASAPDGKIYVEFELEKQESENRISAQLGENGALIVLTALDGDIRVRKIIERKRK